LNTKKENPLNNIRKLRNKSQDLGVKKEGEEKEVLQKEEVKSTKKKSEKAKASKENKEEKDIKSAAKKASEKKTVEKKKDEKKTNEKKLSVGMKQADAQVQKAKKSVKKKEKETGNGNEVKEGNLIERLEAQIMNIIKEKDSKPKKSRGKAKNKKKVKIIPLGGLEQIGMNITAFEYDDSIIIVDCGLAFPSEDMLGIDLVIPDVSYLRDNFSKLKGFVITHGHEDHIGALPYILKQINIPVYGTKLTLALIDRKLKEHNIDKTAKLKEVKHGDTVSLGDFKVEFIRTNHSIQDASSLAIFSPVGIIFHTGDFKIDYTPIYGEPADLQRMAEIGKQGCLALICESTNATKPGFTSSERCVGRTFNMIFSENKNNRIIVATFASNVDRVQQIIDTAYRYDRKVVIEGRSMVNVIGVANELGYIKVPEGTLIETDRLKDYPPEKTVIITTGSQGESMAALSRMANSTHKKVSILPGDTVIMSSTPIPGNEKAVYRVINELSIKGAKVVFEDTHVSGHACQEEIKLMYALLHPKFSLPIHGEFRHRMAQHDLAVAMGLQKDNIIIMQSGDVVELSQDECKINGHVEAGGIFVDGLGVGDVGNIVLRDRQNLAQNGIIVIALSLEKGSNMLLSGPDIVSRGFVYVRESEDLMEEAVGVVRDAMDNLLDAKVTDWTKIKNELRDTLSNFLWKRIKRNPVILPIIMEV
jgi:hypothetical protein